MTDESYNPYCPDCTACGEEGCCSPLICKHTETGSYCKSYLKDLRFGYHMNTWFHNNLYNKLPDNLKEEYDKEWDKSYDQYYKEDEQEEIQQATP